MHTNNFVTVSTRKIWSGTSTDQSIIHLLPRIQENSTFEKKNKFSASCPALVGRRIWDPDSDLRTRTASSPLRLLNQSRMLQHTGMPNSLVPTNALTPTVHFLLFALLECLDRPDVREEVVAFPSLLLDGFPLLRDALFFVYPVLEVPMFLLRLFPDNGLAEGHQSMISINHLHGDFRDCLASPRPRAIMQMNVALPTLHIPTFILPEVGSGKVCNSLLASSCAGKYRLR